METYSMPYEVRWTDIDANRHVRYSAYIDAAAELRYRFFTQHNLPPEAFDQLGVGPVYTSLTANFFREVRLGENITITYLLTGLSPQGIRWKVQHDFPQSEWQEGRDRLSGRHDPQSHYPSTCHSHPRDHGGVPASSAQHQFRGLV